MTQFYGKIVFGSAKILRDKLLFKMENSKKLCQNLFNTKESCSNNFQDTDLISLEGIISTAIVRSASPMVCLLCG
ncbi:hypothetical protein JW979_02290 [bacterium]|nr:hypothetical protein [candidate division CSSED10-310 bacterium]